MRPELKKHKRGKPFFGITLIYYFNTEWENNEILS
jgi:hypothetical protein